MEIQKVIFARIGYMHYYSGSKKGDRKPQHGGSYNLAEIGHELYNFKKAKNNLFGYFQPFGAAEESDKPVTINLERIDPDTETNNKISNVMVIFVSKRENYGQVIIGWYNNATVYRNYQKSKRWMLRADYRYNLKATTKEATLLPEKYRNFKIPTGSGAFGRANVVYLTESNCSQRNLNSEKFNWMKNSINFVNSYDGPNLLYDITSDAEQEVEDIFESHRAGHTGQGFKITPELRKKIEKYSVGKAIKYFRKNGFTVKDVGSTHSYDLHCLNGEESLRVEVKGTQTEGESIILTPNEVKNAKNHKSALYLLHSIDVKTFRKSYKLSGGKEKIINPWTVTKDGVLKALSYIYTLK